MATNATGTAQADFVRRALVTLAALVIFRAGRQWPLPGVSPEALELHIEAGQAGFAASNAAFAQISGVSLLALGVLPLISAAMIGELLVLFLAPLRAWLRADPRNEDYFAKLVAGAGLALALMQAVGLIVAFEQSPRLVAEPGWEFRIGAVAGLFGGVVVTIVLARWISRDGFGNGVWTLFAAEILVLLPDTAAQLLDHAGQGNLSPGLVWAVFALIVAAVLVIVAMELGRYPAEPGQGEARLNLGGVWPLFIAGVASAGMLALATVFLERFSLRPNAPTSLGSVGVVASILGAACVWFICWLYELRQAEKTKARLPAGRLLVRAALPAAALSILLVCANVLTGLGGLPPYLAASGIAIAIIVPAHLRANWPGRQAK